MLFQLDLSGGSPAEIVAQFWGEAADTVEAEDERAFAEQLVRGVARQQDELDRWIVGSAENWRLERMAVVDRNVLRLAVYEMLEDPETPVPVVIDEAVEIAKKFGSSDSGSFINGVLDSIRRRIAGGRDDEDPSRSSGSTP